MTTRAIFKIINLFHFCYLYIPLSNNIIFKAIYWQICFYRLNNKYKKRKSNEKTYKLHNTNY